MARGGRKKTGLPSWFQKGGQKDKKPFWSYFFEPVPEDRDDDDLFFDEPDEELLEEVAPARRFDGPELSNSAMPDAVQPAWTDGEPPLSARPASPASPDALQPADGSALLGAQPAIPSAYVPLGTPVQTTDNPYAFSGASVPVADGSALLGAQPAIPSAYVPLGTPVQATDNPYAFSGASVPAADGSALLGAQPAIPSAYVPLGTPVQATDNPYAFSGASVPAADGSALLGAQPAIPSAYVPLGTPVQATDNPYAFSGASVPAADGAYPLQGTTGRTAGAPFAVDPAARADSGAPSYGQPSGRVPRMDDDAYDDEPFEDDAEDIQLFDEVADADEVRARERGQTTRLFRTGTGATTRIHINETEDAIRMEEAAKRSRAREARKKHEVAMERQGRRKKRNQLLRKLFANVAFVLFLIVAVVVALYYGFLLSDVVVRGNNTYSSDYIIGLSGLKLGTHMLFCDLDSVKENVQQDPYLQVDQVTYVFPSRVLIMVSERQEVAGIIGLDYNVIIDDKGYVLSMSGGTDISDLLQVTGVSTTGFQLGQQLGEGNDLGTATLVQIIAKLEEYQLMDSVKSIDMTTPLAITFTASNGLNVHLGQSTDLDNKLSTFSRLLPQFISQNIYDGTLYLSAKGGAVYSPAGAALAAAAEAGDLPEETPLPDEAPVPGEGDQAATPADGAAPADGTTPDPNASPALPNVTPPPATPTPYHPGGSSDEFQG